jgi:hypothetical protein
MSGTIMTSAEYMPGPWVGMVASRMWLIADLDPRDPAVARCWALVAGAASVDQVLGALTEAEPGAALNLAIVRVDKSGAEVVVRGEAWAEVTEESTVDKDPLELRAGPGSFRDAKVDRFGVIRLHLFDEPDDGIAEPTGLPVGTGVVPVHGLTIRATVPAVSAAMGSQPLLPVDDSLVAGPGSDAGEPTGRVFAHMFGKTVHPTEQVAQPMEVPEDWMAGMRRPAGEPTDASGGATLPPPHTLAEAPVMEGYRSPFEEPPAVAYQPAPAARADPFTDVSWAAVPETASAGPDPFEQYRAAHPSPGSYEPSTTFQLPTPLAPVPTPAQVPVRPAPVPTPPIAASPTPTAGIDPELLQTVQRAPTASVAIGPMVGAVRCDLGHPNPPAANLCRICGRAISPQTPQPMPRPRLGVLRLSTGEVVPLDRNVILGRAPGAPEGFGRDEPYRIQLPSPDNSISRRHVEVVLQGWLVAVVDLKSTNGTQVTPPGGMPEQLPSGGRRVIDHGSIVSLDANTSFRFEVTE